MGSNWKQKHKLNAVSVANYSIWSRNLSINSSHTWLEGISLPQVISTNVQFKKYISGWIIHRTHIVLHWPIPEFCRHHLEYLTTQPSSFGHRGVRIPIWRNFLKASGRRWLIPMLDVLSSHRTYNEAEDNVAKLVPCRKWDEWVVNFGRTRRLEVGHGGQLQYGYPWIRCIQLSWINSTPPNLHCGCATQPQY